MDTHYHLIIRFVILATMFVLWIVGVGLVGYFGRRRSSPTSPVSMPADGARGEAANAASGRSPLKNAA